MSKKFIFLLSFFVMLLVACVAIILLINNPSFFPQGENVRRLFNQKPTSTPISIITLSFSQPNMIVSQGQTNTIDVVINSEGNSTITIPKLIQLEIGYDPTALSDVTIQPGDFATNPTVLLNLIDQQTGRISYALETSTQKEQNTKGIVARLTFTTTQTFLGKQTFLSFLPKTVIRGKTNANILTNATGATLIFSEQK